MGVNMLLLILYIRHIRLRDEVQKVGYIMSELIVDRLHAYILDRWLI